jgi:excisionase family DNA binding protein
MSLVSVIQAAKLVNVSRKTVYQYMKDGKISASKNRLGKIEIDTSELFRVFSTLQGDMSLNDTSNHAATTNDGQVTSGKMFVSPPIEVLLENARLQAENSQLRERLDEAKQDKEMFFARLSEAQASIKLLTNTNQRKGFWARLMGRYN